MSITPSHHPANMKVTVVLLLTLCTSLLAQAQRRKRPRGSRRSDDPLERSSRGLVPQLMANYSSPELPPAGEVVCSQASLVCVNREGCGLALQHYISSCSDLVTGLTNTCSKDCRLALIALLSTPEGERLMQCQCQDEDCLLQKERVEPCRSEVTWNTREDTVVSCTAATWICAADPLCSTAMDYYNRNCHKMFKGIKCSRRCKNSLDILLRQKAAAKLSTCYCDGTEDFECVNIRRNTDVLCFGKKDPQLEDIEDIEDNSIDGDQKPRTSGAWRDKSLSLVIISVLASWALTELGSILASSVQSVSCMM